MRDFAGLTQEELAERIGISVTHLSNLERGISAPSFGLVTRICSTIGLRPVNLFHFPDGEDWRENVLSNGRDETLGFVNRLGVWTYDVAAGRETWSEGLYSLLGYTTERPEPSFELILEHVHPDDKEQSELAFAEAVAGKPPRTIRARFRTCNGVQRIALVGGVALENEYGQGRTIHGAALDITEWVAAEDELLEMNRKLEARVAERTSELEETVAALAAEVAQRAAAEKVLAENLEKTRRAEQVLETGRRMEAVGRLSAAVAHEFNNLLAVITGHAELLGPALDDRNRDHVEAIVNATERATVVTRQLLQAAGQGQRQQPRIDVDELIAAVAEEQSAATSRVVFEHQLEAPESSRGATSPDPPAMSRTSTGTVLVIDDEQMILDMMAANLQSVGWRTILAHGGQEGIESFADNHQELDLVILDVKMPEIDGTEVFRRMRQKNGAVPVLFASGHGPELEIGELLEEPDVAFIRKPFRRRQLLEKMAELLATD